MNNTNTNINNSNSNNSNNILSEEKNGNGIAYKDNNSSASTKQSLRNNSTNCTSVTNANANDSLDFGHNDKRKSSNFSTSLNTNTILVINNETTATATPTTNTNTINNTNMQTQTTTNNINPNNNHSHNHSHNHNHNHNGSNYPHRLSCNVKQQQPNINKKSTAPPPMLSPSISTTTLPLQNRSSSTSNPSFDSNSTNSSLLLSRSQRQQHQQRLHLDNNNNNNNNKPNTTMLRQQKTNKNVDQKQDDGHQYYTMGKAANNYQDKVNRYYEQLTKGCGHKGCTNHFCASAFGGALKLKSQAAFTLAMELSTKSNNKFCLDSPSTIKKKSKKLDNNNRLKDQKKENNDKSSSIFLQTLFSTAAFTSFFSNESSTSLSALSMIEEKDDKKDESIPTLSKSTTNQKLKNKERSYNFDQEEKDKKDTVFTTITTDIQNLQTAKEKLESFYQNNDIQGISYWLQQAFRHWQMVGNAFLDTNLKMINQSDLIDFYNMLFLDQYGTFHHKNQTNNKQVNDDSCEDKEHKEEDEGKCNESEDNATLNVSISLPHVISESFELLLDQMHMNINEITKNNKTTIREWSRSLICLIVWIFLCHQYPKSSSTIASFTPTLSASSSSTSSTSIIINSSSQHSNSKEEGDVNNLMDNKLIPTITHLWPSMLTQKFIQVMSKLLGSNLQSTLIKHISRLNPDIMKVIVQHLLDYLNEHFHMGPYRHGENDTVIMSVKALALFYQANVYDSLVISNEIFIDERLNKKLNIKDEYKIWKRILAYGEGIPSVSALTTLHQLSNNNNSNNKHKKDGTDLIYDQQRRSRLFLTTTNFTSILLPYPFVNQYQFSWFSYSFLLSPSIKRKVLLRDCMSSMSVEYEDACVNHTLLVQAQRLLSESSSRMLKSLENQLKSAICPYLLLEIRRQSFLQDTLHQLSLKWVDLKKPLKIKFVDGGEEGVDQGGVQKEFFNVLFEMILSSETGLFQLIEGETTRLYWFRSNPSPDVRTYEMIGVLLGLAIYNGVILNLPLPMILWKIICVESESIIDAMITKEKNNYKRKKKLSSSSFTSKGYGNSLFTLEDLKQGWPQLAHGLEQLLLYDGDVPMEDIFYQSFEMTTTSFEEGMTNIELIPGGSSILVNKDNRIQYVQEYCHHFMFWLHREAILALRRGVWCVLGGQALQLLKPEELEMITCGLTIPYHGSGDDNDLIKMKELEKVAEYDDGYHIDHPVIKDFWSIVHHDMTFEQKKKLLYFVTASDRIPVGGLKELTFVIQRNGPDSDRLPTALTCFSRLLLPEYSSRSKLKDRLITSIENAKGFGLV
ncbi:unnamed protein product [Cunninghamella blakesleeana]